MKKKTRQRLVIVVFIAIAIYLIVLSQIDRFGLLGGNWHLITMQLIDYFPQLVGISLGFIMIIHDTGYSETTSGRLILVTGLTGVFFASLFFELNIDNIWIDELITASFTILDLQIITVLFFLLLGILLGLIKR